MNADPQPCLVETKTIVVPVSGQPPCLSVATFGREGEWWEVL